MTITQFILIVALFNFALSFYVLKTDVKSALNRWFALCSFQLGFWVLLNYFFQLSNSIFVLRAIYAWVPFAVISGFSWISYFKNNQISRTLRALNYLQLAIGLIFAVLMMTSSQMIASVVSYSNYETGFLFRIYSIYMVIVMVAFLAYIVIQYLKSTTELRKQFRLISTGMFIMVSVSALVGVVLPAMGISKYNMLDSPSSVFFVLLGAYSIVNNKFLDIRSAATEIIAYLIIILMFVYLFFIGDSAGIGLKMILFAILIWASWILIRSVRKEIASNVQIEHLAQHLEEDKKELIELDQMKDEFLQMATHELNTPITAIQGKLDMAVREDMCKLDDKQKSFFKPILDQTMRLARLSKDVLNVARIDQHRLTINAAETDINALIAQIVAGFDLKVKEKNNTIAYVPAASLPKLMVDQSKISEVMTNLITNANKFTENGKITVAAKPMEGNILFSVTDTGIGIDKKDQEHLFEKFYQAGRFNADNPQEQQGSGLGLYISQNIINLHGGKMWLESDLGQGSTFYFSLPLEYKEVRQTNKLHSDALNLKVL